jgi:GNAT superfamily N-acetyltransferase
MTSSSVTLAKAMNPVPRRPFSQFITQTTRAFLVSTAWLRALWLTLTRRRRFAAASPRHDVPGFLLARIATDLRCQGQGIGGQLLAAAARRCLRASAEVGGVVLIIDAKNDRAARWYASYGAVPLIGKPLTLVMSLASFAADLKAAGQL